MRPLRTVPAGYTIALVYFILSAASLVSLGKSGAGSNYLVPWVSSWALLIGLAVVEIAGRARQRQQPFILALLFGALIAQALATPKFEGIPTWSMQIPQRIC